MKKFLEKEFRHFWFIYLGLGTILPLFGNTGLALIGLGLVWMGADMSSDLFEAAGRVKRGMKKAIWYVKEQFKDTPDCPE